MISGVVLAAGRSLRMGTPKALLTVSGESFLARTVGALRQGGCGEVVVVVGPAEDPETRQIAAAAERQGARVASNPVHHSEQIDSLVTALCSVGDATEAVVVTPVDFPRIRAETVRQIIEAFHRTAAPVVLPTCDGKPGHPTLFARQVWSELFAADLPQGARTVVHAHAGDRAEVPVDDPAILADVDTPGEYRRLREE